MLLINTFHRLAIGNPTSIRYRRSNENESRRMGRLIADEAAGRYSL